MKSRGAFGRGSMLKEIRISVRDQRNIFPYFIDRPVPPSQPQQPFDRLRIEPLADLACRHSADNRAVS